MTPTSNAPQPAFFVTGGTLPPDASSYVERSADRDLLSNLLAGEYCYVLNSRQMGKSSLSVRTIARLRNEGVITGFVDLTRIGAQNVTAEQWYAGLLAETGRVLDLRKEFLAHWKEHQALPPVQRYFGAIREVALSSIEAPVVLFVDEIDAVRSLAFSADEFFAAMRACYNARTEDPAYLRLTFCLVGSATPADLISDTRMSPFNVGKRVELRDFTREEASPLAQGLGENGQALLDRVLYWTAGHPYLTQRLCSALASQSQPVDTLCRELFLTHTAKESDDNLSFVRNRLLRSEADLAALLDLYGKMRAGRRVPDDETNPLTSVLKLSGVARVEGGQLRVRNRIYEHVFDRQWVEQHMPDAELRRQRQAYRRGLVRASAASLVLITTVSLLALSAARSAREARAKAEQVHKSAITLRRNLYVAEMNEAQQAVDTGNTELARRLLDRQIPLRPEDEDLREFAWRYLDSGLQRSDEKLKLVGHTGAINSVRYSPNGKLLVTAGEDKTVRLWDAATGRQVCVLDKFVSPSVAAVFSRDGASLATLGGADFSMAGELTVWNMTTPTKPTAGVKYNWRAGSPGSLSFSPDGRMLIGSIGGWGGVCDLANGRIYSWWKSQTQFTPHFQSTLSPDGRLLALFGSGKLAAAGASVIIDRVPPRSALSEREPPALKMLNTQQGAVNCTAFSWDSRILACGSEDHTVDLWDTVSWRRIGTVHNNEAVRAVAFSPNGKQLATGGIDGVAALWDLSSKRQTARLRGHRRRITSIAFAPDGQSFATSSEDGTTRIWDTAPRADRASFAAHHFPARCLSMAPVGGLIATAATDLTVKVWRWPRFAPVKPFTGASLPYTAIAFSPDGGILATASADDHIYLWDVIAGRELKPSMPHWVAQGLAFSPDGRMMVSASVDGTVRQWDIYQRRMLRHIEGGSGVVFDAAFEPNGKRFCVGYADGKVGVFDAASGRPVASLFGHVGAVKTVAFSPDGKLLATGGDDGTVRFWSTADWKRTPEILTARLDNVSHIVFSPDGRSMATAHDRGGVAIWNVALRSEVAILRSDEFELLRVGFSPDSTALFASSGTGKVLVWDSAGPAEAREREARVEAEREHLAAEMPERIARMEAERQAWGKAVWDRALRAIPARDARATASQIDLTAFYNATLTESFEGYDLEHPSDFEEAPRGLQTLAGTLFDIRGMVYLSDHTPNRDYPPQVTNIPINQQCGKLVFLHTCTWGQDKDGTQIGRYVMHYADGKASSQPIIAGRDVRDWYKIGDRRPIGNVAWEGYCPHSRVAKPASTIRLFKSVWNNPRPGVQIDRVDFVSDGKRAHPLLIAITAE